jgi:hypothetical protein
MKKTMVIIIMGMLCTLLNAMGDDDEETPLAKPPQNSMVWPRPPTSSRLSRETSCCEETCYLHCCLPLYCLCMCSSEPFPGSSNSCCGEK